MTSKIKCKASSYQKEQSKELIADNFLRKLYIKKELKVIFYKTKQILFSNKTCNVKKINFRIKLKLLP